ncbi:type II toxin-antitoxin system VapC family toxin [Microvirga sp. P5_D2]
MSRDIHSPHRPAWPRLSWRSCQSTRTGQPADNPIVGEAVLRVAEATLDVLPVPDGNHPKQSAQAPVFIDRHTVCVGTTALLETEWVLRGANGYAPAQIGEALWAFAGLPQVKLEDPALTARALDGMAQGMDFADALHLVTAEGCAVFASFDRQFAKAARRLSQIEVRHPSTLGATRSV